MAGLGAVRSVLFCSEQPSGGCPILSVSLFDPSPLESESLCSCAITWLIHLPLSAGLGKQVAFTVCLLSSLTV